MAKGKNSKEGSRADFSRYKFINLQLSLSEQSGLRALEFSEELGLQQIFDLVQEDIKFSLSENKDNHCFVASLTDRVQASDGNFYILTGRGSTPANAVASVLYKHIYVLQGDWSSAYATDGNEVPEFS